MNVATDLSLAALGAIRHLPVQIVMGILLAVSLTSWTTIFRKWFALRSEQQETETFEKNSGVAVTLASSIKGRLGGATSPAL